jgi:hypothetical protein
MTFSGTGWITPPRSVPPSQGGDTGSNPIGTARYVGCSEVVSVPADLWTSQPEQAPRPSGARSRVRFAWRRRPAPTDSLLFTDEKGGPLRPHVLPAAWDKARGQTSIQHLHFHDLRHSGNTWAATGASTAELMVRMGDASAQSRCGFSARHRRSRSGDRLCSQFVR